MTDSLGWLDKELLYVIGSGLDINTLVHIKYNLKKIKIKLLSLGN